MKYLFFLTIFLSLLFTSVSDVAAQVKIMPIGDSITDLDGSYRCPLYDKLRASGYQVKSVGSESDPYPRSGCSNGGNITHFGYSGVSLQGVRDIVRGSINSVEIADYALIHLATNNYWPRNPFKPYTPQDHQGNLDAMKDLISIIRARSPQTKILVAQIIGNSNQEMDGYIRTFNFSYLNTLSGQPNVYLVDQYTGYNPGSDSYDGTHPREGAGNIKMADKWLSVMLPLLRNQPIPSSAPVSIAPAPSVTPVPPPATSSPVASPVRRPYGGTPAIVPGKIEAENYDEGGMNVAYYDRSSGNNGNIYRNNDVDIESNRVGGTSIGWIETSEWLSYTFRVAQTGRYLVSAQVASANSGGRFDFTIDGQVGGSFNIDSSAGWFNWYSVSSGVIDLTAGEHLLRVTAAAGNASAVANFDYLQVEAVANAPSPTPISVTPSPLPSDNLGSRLDLNRDGAVNRLDVMYIFSRWSL